MTDLKKLVVLAVPPIFVALYAVGMALEGPLAVSIFLLCFLAIMLLSLRIQRIREVLVRNLARPTQAFLFSFCISLALLPLFQVNQPYAIYIEISAYVLAMMTLGLSLTLGLTGMVDLGIGFFIGIGAYVAARTSINLGVSAVLTPFLGGIVSLALARIIALPILRVRGHYFAVATLGLALVGYNLFIQLKTLTLGVDGISGIPSLKILQFDASKSMTLFSKVIPFQINVYYWVLLYFIVIFLFVNRLSSGHFGRCARSLRDNEKAASSSGINVPSHRSWVYAISGFIAGYAGALHAHTVNYIAPADFGLKVSIFLLSVAVLGGMGNPLACVFAAFGITFLQEKFREFGDLRLLLVAAAILVVVILRARKGLGRSFFGSSD